MSTQSIRPIDKLKSEWEVLGRSKDAELALGNLANLESGIAVLALDNLGDLLEYILGVTGREQRARSAELLRAMLRSSSAHPLIPRAILQCLIPGLIGVARRLRWGHGGDWEDGGSFFSDLLGCAWEVIQDWSDQDRPYAVLDLLSAIRCRMRRIILSQSSTRIEVPLEVNSLELVDESPYSTSGATSLEQLARAIEDLSGHGLDKADAAVIYAHRVLGLSIAELSRISGCSSRRLYAGRTRAEQLLCA